jgi:hypothetical protein
MSKTVGIFFGKEHDPEKNTTPLMPTFKVLDEAEVRVVVVTSPEVERDTLTNFYLNASELRVMGGKLVARALEGGFNPLDLDLIYDKNGTLKDDYTQPVINAPSVVSLSRGKGVYEDLRKDVLEQSGVNFDFQAQAEATIGGIAHPDIVVPEGLRIYHHVSEDPEIAGLMTPVLVGKSDKEKLTYRTIDPSLVPDEVVEGSLRVSRQITDVAGVKEALAAPSWVNKGGLWVMTAPNMGNIQYGATLANKDPLSTQTREYVGKHLVSILSRSDKL